MAHRTTGAAFFAGPSFWLKPSRIAPLREAEKQQSIPARSGHLARDGAQRPVTARVELKAVCEHLHDNLTVAQSACKECARGRQSPVSLRLGASNHTYRIRGNLTGQQFLRRPGAEVGIIEDLGGAAACAFAQATFSVGLQAPGDAPEQELFIRGFRLLPEYLLVFLSQHDYVRAPQLIDRGEHGWGHVRVLSLAVNYSHMTALCGPESKREGLRFTSALRLSAGRQRSACGGGESGQRVESPQACADTSTVEPNSGDAKLRT